MPSVAPVTTAHEPSFFKFLLGRRKYTQTARISVMQKRRMTTRPMKVEHLMADVHRSGKTIARCAAASLSTAAINPGVEEESNVHHRLNAVGPLPSDGIAKLQQQHSKGAERWIFASSARRADT